MLYRSTAKGKKKITKGQNKKKIALEKFYPTKKKKNDSFRKKQELFV